MHAVAIGVGTHWQVVVGEPMQACPLEQAVQLAGSPQPLLTSVGTHLSPHFFVPAPQLPMTQAPL